MPDIDPLVRDRNANGGSAAPSNGRPDAPSVHRRSGRGAAVAVRALWLALGFALGVSAGLIWAGSVIAGG
jgi:uncharacterized protein HemX